MKERPVKRTSALVALLALIGALSPAIADPVRTSCQADDAIPEFVMLRIELVSAVPAGDPRGAPTVELAPGPVCRRGFGTGH
jgi:hypothetical protein